MFSVEERDAARAFVVRMASDDSRITAGALVGSFARGAEDRWSDLDLTFAVADDVPLGDVLGDGRGGWKRHLMPCPCGTFVFGAGPIGCSCCPAGYRSISPSRRRRSFALLDRRSPCSLARLGRQIRRRRRLPTISSGWVLSRLYTGAGASSGRGIGKQNRPSAKSGSAPCRSRACSTVSSPVTAGGLTTFLRTRLPRLPRLSWHRSSQTD